MSCLTLAAAQYPTAAANIACNLERHLEFVAQAADQQVQLLVFPELSLSGYELTDAAELALTLGDPHLQPLSAAAQSRQMTIIVGAPLRSGTALHIAALIFRPNGALSSYTKQHLHGAEQQYFSPGEGGSLLELHHHNIALAICADTSEPGHASAAALAGAHIYAAGVLVSEAGYAKDSAALAGYARRYGMVTLMANHAAPTGGWIPAGRSAIWDNTGELLVAAPDDTPGLIIADKTSDGWHGRLCQLS
ncbi:MULTISPECIES: carbon-nitrogen hydrolase family protein [Serratia]|uniref:carbon-nitrogen hydrolase family protein n=1 Tax=Serratia TaxID=613 RepID=UPI0013DB1423|nr:carbon-nitrogen hydrolase family protein [Serratia marcescens]MBH3045636.1 carbon-nitrogen hydrolase family protein [Serratia marcescens]MBH3145766.1 carbon-nitrogen hydrolase family protein [Serratia marcescens]MDT8209682.1 carbon-nitrogen hydrolase family protein [Serratia marcescens]